jgi:hypothetical protein
LENFGSVLSSTSSPSALLCFDFSLPDAPPPLRRPCAEHWPPRAALNRATCRRFPDPRWTLPALPRCSAICPGRSPLLLIVITARSASLVCGRLCTSPSLSTALRLPIKPDRSLSRFLWQNQPELKWNPRCIDTRNLCIVPESLSDRCFANRTGRSRVISCHSCDIGVECLLFCNHYKDDGRGHVLYHDSEGYPVCVDKSS